MGHAVFIFGAAGSGKTTFCKNIREFALNKRSIKLINLDPAQEDGTDYDIDLCNHITVGEVMDEMDFGPNGALFYALEQMSENLDELHLEEMQDEFFIFDCPGQIELFLHSDILKKTIEKVKTFSKVAIVYLLDSSNFLNSQKLLYTLLCATISTYRFDLPVLNLISKADLIEDEILENILSGDYLTIHEDMRTKEEDNLNSSNSINSSTSCNSSNGKMLKTITEYIENNGMMNFLPLNYKEENTVENVLLYLDNVLQRYDDEEPKEGYQEE